jgi:hypothetical protein
MLKYFTNSRVLFFFHPYFSLEEKYAKESQRLKAILGAAETTVPLLSDAQPYPSFAARYR